MTVENRAVSNGVETSAETPVPTLAERPDAIGLSVPSRPRGSPGMDGPVYGGIRDPYDVLLIDRDGRSSVFQSYR